jgi:hypothetical protein
MERLEQLRRELESAGKLELWKTFCSEQQAHTVERQIELAEQVLAIRGSGSVGEGHVAHALHSGARTRHSTHPYRPTGY